MKAVATFKSIYGSGGMTIENDELGFRFEIDGPGMVVDYDEVDDLIKYLATFRGDS